MSRAPISAVPSSANARSASRTAAVSSPSCASQARAASRIRSADEPVVGLHHRVGEEHLPLDGADRENREAAVVRELAEPVGEVALPLPAQPRDPMRRDLVEEAFRNIEALDVLEAVQQPVGVGGIAAWLELLEPDPHRRRERSSVHQRDVELFILLIPTGGIRTAREKSEPVVSVQEHAGECELMHVSGEAGGCRAGLPGGRCGDRKGAQLFAHFGKCGVGTQTLQVDDARHQAGEVFFRSERHDCPVNLFGHVILGGERRDCDCEIFLRGEWTRPFIPPLAVRRKTDHPGFCRPGAGRAAAWRRAQPVALTGPGQSVLRPALRSLSANGVRPAPTEDSTPGRPPP